jgi:hypothetical protein
MTADRLKFGDSLERYEDQDYGLKKLIEVLKWVGTSRLLSSRAGLISDM